MRSAVLALFSLVRLAAADTGPVEFTWPTARTWVTTSENSLPCGTTAGSGDRTNFPLTNGAVALQINDESYRINLAIAYVSNPSVNSQFGTMVSYSNFPVLEPGNECYSVPDPASGVAAGQVATLQLSYVSTDSSGDNATYYSCADIVYVALTDFTEDVSCYNYTSSTGVTESASGVAPTPAKTSGSSSGSSGKKLSGGAIAGIVVGVVAGVVLVIAAVTLIFFRKRNQRWRIRMADIRVAELKRMDAIRAREEALKSQA